MQCHFWVTDSTPIHTIYIHPYNWIHWECFSSISFCILSSRLFNLSCRNLAISSFISFRSCGILGCSSAFGQKLNFHQNHIKLREHMSNFLVVEIRMTKVVHCTDWQHHIHPKLSVSQWTNNKVTLNTSRFGPAIAVEVEEDDREDCWPIKSILMLRVSYMTRTTAMDSFWWCIQDPINLNESMIDWLIDYCDIASSLQSSIGIFK